MSERTQLNTSWLAELTNPIHDGTTQQIDDFAQAFVTDNAVFNQKRTALHQARQAEDEVWLTAQRDPAVKSLEAADKKQDLYGDERLRSCLNEHAGEKAEAVCCEILADVDRFSNGEPQFDDITELSLRFLKYRESSH